MVQKAKTKKSVVTRLALPNIYHTDFKNQMDHVSFILYETRVINCAIIKICLRCAILYSYYVSYTYCIYILNHFS